MTRLCPDLSPGRAGAPTRLRIRLVSSGWWRTPPNPARPHLAQNPTTSRPGRTMREKPAPRGALATNQGKARNRSPIRAQRGRPAIWKQTVQVNAETPLEGRDESVVSADVAAVLLRSARSASEPRARTKRRSYRSAAVIRKGTPLTAAGVSPLDEHRCDDVDTNPSSRNLVVRGSSRRV